MRLKRGPNLSAMVVALVLVAVLACIVGAVTLGNLTDLTPAAQERQRIENAHLEKQLEIERQLEATKAAEEAARVEAEHGAKVAFAIGWRIALIVAIFGLIFAVVAFAVHRSELINANRQGQFPLLTRQVNGAWVVHDPNRTVSGVTAIGGAPQVKHYLPPGQEQVTSQAQAVQLAAALASGEKNHNPADALLNIRQRILRRALPPVRSANWEPGEVEQLLIEAGEMMENNYGQ